MVLGVLRSALAPVLPPVLGLAIAWTLAQGFQQTAAHAQPASQNWPQRTVKVIMPLPAGTGADAALRMFAEKLSQRWGQPVVVENRPGAEGVIAVSSFIKMKDDHALLFSYGGPITISPIVTKDLGYDPARELPAGLK